MVKRAEGRRQWITLLLIVLGVLGLAQASSWWQTRQLAQSMRESVGPGDIVMYSTDTCTFCRKAEAWLHDNQIAWTNCPIDHNPTCKAEYDHQGAPGTPLFKMRHDAGQVNWVLGFDPVRMARALKEQP